MTENKNPGAGCTGAEKDNTHVGQDFSSRSVGGPGADDARLIREKTPSLWGYLRRVGADTKSFRRHVVEEEGEPAYGRMRRARATIRTTDDGTVSCDNEDLAPTAEELAAIEPELARAGWPTSINTTEARVRDLARQLGGRPTLYVFKNLAGTEVELVQQRVYFDDGHKSDLPWTYWSDGAWRKMEPDADLLPLFGLEQLARGGPVMIREGAKTASYLQWLTARDDVAARKQLAAHPWGVELSNYVHLGWPGGAPSPHRVDWGKIRTLERSRGVTLVCDRDQIGIEAAPAISGLVRRKMAAIIFDDRFREGFDLANDPTEHNPDFWQGRRYVGPRLEDFTTPATWATDAILDKKGRPSLKVRSEFAQDWLMVSSPSVFVHRGQPQRLLNQDTFNRMVRPFSDAEDTARLLARHRACHVDGITYLPGEKTGVIAKDGHHLINSFRPSSVKPVKGDSRPWLDFMEHLVPEEDDRLETMRWCATLIARPKTRMHYGMLLISVTQGVGKGTVAEILAALVGHHNTSVPNEQAITDGSYNGWMAHRRLAVCHEIYSGHSRKAYDRLKSTITDTRTEINRKYIEEYEIDICVHVLACSNSLQALHLDDEDRRWFVPRVGSDVKTPEYWRDLHAWLRDDGLGVIRQWAEDFLRDHPAVETGERAPMSAMKAEVIAGSRSAGQQLVFDLVDHILEMTTPVVLAVEDVRDWVAGKRGLDGNDQRMEKPLTIRKALLAAGMHEPEQIKGKPTFRAKVNGRKSHVVASFPLGKVSSWADISPSHRELKDIKPY